MRAAAISALAAFSILAAPQVAGAAARTHSCGILRAGLGVAVRTTRDVPCPMARSVIAESRNPQCYVGRHPTPCTVQGFRCLTVFDVHRPIARTHCQRGGSLILGTEGPFRRSPGHG